MIFTKTHVELIALAFFSVVAGVVFYQIDTVLGPAGMASGDPFHNAAFYPRIVAFIMVGCVFLRAVFLFLEIRSEGRDIAGLTPGELARPVILLCIFAAFVWLFSPLGYHIVSAPLIALIMLLCGERRAVPIVGFSLAASLMTAFLFEKFLKIVLPIGLFPLNFGW